MHFEIAHEFDIPLDALELAVVSPDLVEKLGAKVRDLGGEHRDGPERHPLAAKEASSSACGTTRPTSVSRSLPAEYVTREMCAWDEQTVYEMSRHQGEWTIVPNVKPEWRQYF